MKTEYKVCDAMTRRPVTVSPDTSIKECAKIMAENKVGSLIIEHDEELVESRYYFRFSSEHQPNH